MADIESNIDINIDASGALNSLRQLQRQISAFQTSMSKSGEVTNSKLRDMQQNLVNNVNATGQFSASIQRVKTTTESFTTALEKNKLSMGQYFKYAIGSTQTFGKAFRTEFDTIDKVARERVKTLQTQYIKLGRDASGAMQAIAIRPQVLDMKDLGTQTAIAAQKAQLFNQLLQQGSTNLLNLGKNTQWAGRQLMVGFTIPLGIMGAAASKEFKKIEEQVLRLERVYGDFNTTVAETQQTTQHIRDLANEYTKYGIAVEKTIGLAADAAAMGAQGADLIAQVAEATRLAALGGVTQQQSLETTISLTSAFGVATEDLAKKTDFLNAVENQTITSIEDLTEAIPKAGPVIKQLGGNVEDLTFFLTAMREGGINASESANALKSGLASLINPTDEASEMLAGFGINLQGIVDANKGNVKGIVIEFAKALDTLDPLNRAQAIEQLFGKFQFSRLSTLFQNVIAEGSQASRVLELTRSSAAELAALSERELGKIESSPLYQFEGAIERFKAAIAPVGEDFMKAVTPIINFGTDILNAFNSWSDGAKQFTVVAVAAIGGIGPVLLMTIGLIMNGFANIVKGILFIRNGFKNLGGQSNILTQQLGYMNSEQLENAAVAASLNQVHNTLIQTFTSEASAVRNLAGAYMSAINAQNAFVGPQIVRGTAPKRMASGGIVRGPGSGTSDSIPAMLSNGEAVIPAASVKKYPGMVSGLIAGNVPGFADGRDPSIYGGQERLLGPYTMRAPGNVAKGFGMSRDFLGKDDFTRSLSNTLIAATATESGMRLSAKKVNEMAEIIDPVSEQITQHLRSAERELLASGKSVSHISELFEKKQKEIMSAIPASNKPMQDAMRKLAYATDDDIMSGGNARVPATSIDAKTGGLLRKTMFSVRRGATKAFEGRLNTVEKALGRTAVGTKAHILPEDRTILGGVVPLSGGGTALPAEKRVAAERYINEASKKIVNSASENLASSIDQAAQSKSPSRRAIRTSAKNIVDGVLEPIEKAGARAKKAGEEIASQADAVRKQSRRASKPAGPTGSGSGITIYDPVSGNYFTEEKFRKQEQARETARRRLEAQRRTGVRGRVAGFFSPQYDEQGNAMGSRANRMASKAGGVAMGVGMAASVAGMFIGGEQGQLISSLGMGATALGGLSGLVPLIGSLPPQVSLVVAALAAAVGGIVAFNVAMDNAKKEGRELADAMSMTSKKMEGLSEFTGKTSASQEAALEREKRLSGIGDEGQLKYGEEFLQADVGKAFLEDAQKQLKAGFSMSSVAQSMAAQLSTAIAQGVMTKQQADSIANALGNELNSREFTINAIGKISEIIGPNGEILGQDPIQVTMEITETYRTSATTAASMVNDPERLLKTAEGAVTGAWLGDEWWQRLIGNASSLFGVIGGLSSMAAEYAKYSSQAVTSFGNAYQQGVQMIDVLNKQYDTQIAAKNVQLEAAQTEEDRKRILEEINALETTRTQAIANQNNANQETLKSAKAAREAMGNTIFGNSRWDKAAEEQIGITYAEDSVSKEIATKAFDISETFKNMDARIALSLQISKGLISPTAALNLTEAMAKNEPLQTSYVALLGTAGDQKTIDLISMLAGMEASGETMTAYIEFAMSMGGDADAAEKVMRMMEVAQSIRTRGLDFDVNAKGAQKELSAIDDQIQSITSELESAGYGTEIVVARFTTEGYELTESQLAYFNSLDPSARKEFVSKFITIMETIDKSTVGGRKRMREWALEKEGSGYWKEGGKYGKDTVINGRTFKTDYDAIARDMQEEAFTSAQAAASAFSGLTDTDATPSPTTEPQKDPTSSLDSIVQKIKNVKKAAIGLTDTWRSSMDALMNFSNTAFSGFGGIENQLRGFGANEDAISVITGMGKEEWDKYKNELFVFDAAGNITGITKQFEALNVSLREIKLGEFFAQQQKVANGFQFQISAINKLVGSGMSYASALEVVSDAELARAIATGASADEMASLVRITAEAERATRMLAAAQATANKNRETADRRALASRLAADRGLTDAQKNAILSDSNLAQLYLDPTISPQVLDQALKDAQNAAKLELDIKKLTFDGLVSIFEDGFSKAMEAFAAREKQIQLNFDIKRKPFEDVVKNAQEMIYEINNAPGGIDDLSADLERISDTEEKVNKKYDNRVKALDIIAKLNEKAARQQKNQLSIAEALSRGDIAAAAAAVQEFRAQAANDAVQTERDMLERSREIELGNIRSAMGLNREQIETRIKELKLQILEIEESMLEPAQYQIEMLNRQQEIEIQNLQILGMTKTEWERIGNNIDVAKTGTEEYRKAMQDALGVVSSILNHWKALERTFSTTHNVQQNVHTTYTHSGTPPSGGSGGGAGSGSSGTSSSSSTNFRYSDASGQVVRFSKGGQVGGSGNSDTVPAMLTPGEFVIRKDVVNAFGKDIFEAINSGKLPSKGIGSGQSLKDVSSKVVAPSVDDMNDRFTDLAETISKLASTDSDKSFKSIGKNLKDLYTLTIDPTVSSILQKLGLWGMNTQNMYTDSVKPAYTGIANDTSTLVNGTITPAADTTTYQLSRVGLAFTNMANVDAKPAVNSIAATTKSAWRDSILPTFETMIGYIKKEPGDAFGQAATDIGNKWGAIRNLAKEPVRFVIETVINGLIDTVNGLGLNIAKLKLPNGFSSGGYTGNVPVGAVAGVVHGQEYVINAEAQKRIEKENPGALNYMNEFGKLPGYRFGGFVHPLPGYPVTQWASAGHPALDIGAPAGAPIRAAAPGTVEYAGGVGSGGNGDWMAGNMVSIQHADNLRTLYAHMVGRPRVIPGQPVRAGTHIGGVGNTGYSFGNHLHYEIWDRGRRIDPAPYIKRTSPLLPADILQDLLSTVKSQIDQRYPKKDMWVDIPAKIAEETAKSLTNKLTSTLTDKYDSGGWLMPGKTLVENKTGRPEAVLTAPQWRIMNSTMESLSDITGGKSSKTKNDSVYNNTYSINVNVKSEANADQIARTVIAQIKQVDAQRIRGNRF